MRARAAKAHRHAPGHEHEPHDHAATAEVVKRVRGPTLPYRSAANMTPEDHDRARREGRYTAFGDLWLGDLPVPPPALLEKVLYTGAGLRYAPAMSQRYTFTTSGALLRNRAIDRTVETLGQAVAILNPATPAESRYATNFRYLAILAGGAARAHRVRVLFEGHAITDIPVPTEFWHAGAA